MIRKLMPLATVGLILAGCSTTSHQARETLVPPIMRADYVGDVAETEIKYATKRCTELGVAVDTPEWQTCLREKGAARWALKNCGGPFNSTALWWPTLCDMADLD